MSSIGKLFFLTLVLWSAQWRGEAQVLYGNLVGFVKDPAGASIPSAVVTLRNERTGQIRTVTTQNSGEYTAPDLLSGSYEVRVTAPGFKTYVKTAVPVSINTVTRVDVIMNIGDVVESITTVADPTPLQGDKTDVHAEFRSQEITELPLPQYRNFQSLMSLVPGAAPPDIKSSTSDAPQRSLSSEVNGTPMKYSNVTRVDGVQNRFNNYGSHLLYIPPAESIETVNVTTNNFDADQGMAAGAAVTVITKSGTNQFHGSVFGFHSDNALQARNFFAQSRSSKGILNQDGVAIGGPIRKQKLFFFTDWEGTHERTGYSALLTVPTADLRAGNFGPAAAIYDPATGSADGSGRQLFPGGQIPLNRQSPITLKMQSLVPLPNGPGQGSNYYAAATQPLNRDSVDFKLNYNASAKHTLWGKYSAMVATLSCPPGLGAAGGDSACGSTATSSSNTLVQVGSLGHTWVVTPTFLIETTAGYSRLDQSVKGQDYGKNFGLDTLGIPGTNGPDIKQSGIPSFFFSGFTTLGNPVPSSPLFRLDTVFAYSTSAGWIKHRHDVRFGFDLLHYHQSDWQPNITGGPRGRFDFTGGLTVVRGGRAPVQANSYADFLLGLPQMMQKAIQFYSPQTSGENQLGFYIRDRWQLSGRLTVTLGLRYELYPIMARDDSGIERYDPLTNHVLIGGRGGVPQNAGIESSHLLLAPRMGIAYRLGAKTVLRGGFGVTIDPWAITGESTRPYPVVVGKQFAGVDTYHAFRPIDQGIPAFDGPPIVSGIIDIPGDVAEMTQPLGKLHRGRVNSWNFIVERELPGSFVVTAGYVGTQMIDALAARDMNAGQPGLGQAGQTFFKQFGRTASTLLIDGFMPSDYHSLQTSVGRRLARGLFVKGAYTFSKAITGTRNATATAGGASLRFNSLDQLDRNIALADYDRTHVLQMAWMYQVPLGVGHAWANHGVPGALLSRWEVKGQFSAYTGVPFTVAASATSLNAPANTQTADQVKLVVEEPKNVGPGKPWFDPTAFAAVTAARYGTSGVNILHGPGLVNVNLSLTREFAIKERIRLQFRGESFNFTNTPHFNNPNVTVGNASFGTVTSARSDQRQLRFAIVVRF